MTRFLCDEMLARLGRWLRAAGYDTVIAVTGQSDAELVECAVAEDRRLLTCDTAMAARRAAAGRLLLLSGQNLDQWAGQLTRACGVDWLAAPFTRCLVDNAVLRLHPLGAAAAPPSARARLEPLAAGPVLECPACGRTYWPGSHPRRIRARLERWNQGACS